MILYRRQLRLIEVEALTLSRAKLGRHRQQKAEKKRRDPPPRRHDPFSWRWNGSAYFTKPSFNKGECPPTYTVNRRDDQCNPTAKTRQPSAPYEREVAHVAAKESPGKDWKFKPGEDRPGEAYPADDAGRWFDDASADEKEAVRVYSLGVPNAWSAPVRGQKPTREHKNAYRRFNAFLRGQDKEPHEEDVKWTHALNKAAQFEFEKPVTIYRGIGLSANGEMTAEENQEATLRYYEAMVGKAVKMDGLISTTTGLGTAGTFSKSGLMFEIRTKKGLPMQPASDSPLLEEVLLGHGWSYKVLDVERDTFVGNAPVALVVLEVSDTPLVQPKVEQGKKEAAR